MARFLARVWRERSGKLISGEDAMTLNFAITLLALILATVASQSPLF